MCCDCNTPKYIIRILISMWGEKKRVRFVSGRSVPQVLNYNYTGALKLKYIFSWFYFNVRLNLIPHRAIRIKNIKFPTTTKSHARANEKVVELKFEKNKCWKIEKNINTRQMHEQKKVFLHFSLFIFHPRSARNKTENLHRDGICVVDAHYNLILISYLLYWHSKWW